MKRRIAATLMVLCIAIGALGFAKVSDAKTVKEGKKCTLTGTIREVEGRDHLDNPISGYVLVLKKAVKFKHEGRDGMETVKVKKMQIRSSWAEKKVGKKVKVTGRLWDSPSAYYVCEYYLGGAKLVKD